MTIGFAGIFLLLVGCQGSVNESKPTPAVQTGPISPSLPSISEQAGTAAPEVPPLPTLNSDEIALGQAVYAEYCTECHGENLEGEADWQKQNEDSSFRSPPHDASGHTWHHSDNLLLESIRRGGTRLPDNIGGTSAMPAFAEVLNEQQMAAVLIYIKSTWPNDIVAMQQSR